MDRLSRHHPLSAALAAGLLAAAGAAVAQAPAASSPSAVPVAAQAAASAASAAAAAAPARAESPALAARFPDPPVVVRTPAFEPGRETMTTNAELRTLVHALADDARPTAGTPTTIRLVDVGNSQNGVPLEALHFSRPSAGTPHPAVLLFGQQHGDEPAGAEALLATARELAQGALAPLLDRIDVVILPRANPDGAAAQRRATASGIDVNRDHLLLRTPEAQAIAALVRQFNPIVVVDAHEFAALGRSVEKFDASPRHDALIQYAMGANLPPLVTRAAEEWFRQPLREKLRAQGLASEWYYTLAAEPGDRKVAMGGVQPDTSRNVNGLRHMVSLLIETRGADLGRAHLLRRVHTHMTAVASVLASAAARADDLQRLRRFVDAEVAAQVCQGEIVVEAVPTPSEYTLAMLDPQTGADKPVVVAWDSALALTPRVKRMRPCGYWLNAEQTDAVLRLRGLGVAVQRVEEGGEMRGEFYTETASEISARSDGGSGVLRVKVTTAPALIDAATGSYYVGLDQPLAALVVAALEPDSPASYLGHLIIDNVRSIGRVLRRPALKTSALP